MKVHHLFLVPFFLCALVASAEERGELRISGIYSNLTYNDESGDLQGMEVFIIPRNGPDNAYQAFAQVVEGGAPSTFLVPVNAAGGKIEFTLPQDGSFAAAHFVGRVKEQELVLHQDKEKEEHLKRGKSYWQ
jgi:hypothetical protein